MPAHSYVSHQGVPTIAARGGLCHRGFGASVSASGFFFFTELASPCAGHTVRPINTKQSLEQRKAYYRFVQGDGWLLP